MGYTIAESCSLAASIGAHVHNGRYAAFVAPLLGHGYQKRSINERYIHQNPEASAMINGAEPLKCDDSALFGKTEVLCYCPGNRICCRP